MATKIHSAPPAFETSTPTRDDEGNSTKARLLPGGRRRIGFISCATPPHNDDEVFLPTENAQILPPDVEETLGSPVLEPNAMKGRPFGATVPNRNASVFSDGPAVCRICHGSEASSPYVRSSGDRSGVRSCGRGEPLISPCYCSGTVGLYHRSCLELWLSTSNTTVCEICKFQYVTERRPKPLIEFFRNPGRPPARRNLLGDVICYVVLTPLAFVSIYLCIMGAVFYARAGRDTIELPGLICLAVFLMLTYAIWFMISFRFHYKMWQQWCETNQTVRVLDIDEASARQRFRRPQRAFFDETNVTSTSAHNGVDQTALALSHFGVTV